MTTPDLAAAIDGATEPTNPLAGLVERATQDVGAPFEPEVVDARARLQGDDPAAFERRRCDLK